MNENQAGRLRLLDAGAKGQGVFATHKIRAGALLFCFQGPRLTPEEIVDFTHTIQVSEDSFLGASGKLDDFVNHSCEPNCGLRATEEGLGLFALEDVAPGDEITFDYSTCIVLEPELEACMCGAQSCRGRVSTYVDLDDSTKERYRELGIVPEFVLRSCKPRLTISSSGFRVLGKKRVSLALHRRTAP